jgi:hypothetical protein
MNYDRPIIQYRCSACYREIFKGSCDKHSEGEVVPCLSNFGIVLKDLVGDDTITCYPTEKFWKDNSYMPLDLREIGKKVESEQFDRSALRTQLIERFLLRRVIFDGYLTIREIPDRNGSTKDATRKVRSIRVSNLEILSSSFEHSQERIPELMQQIMKEAQK